MVRDSSLDSFRCRGGEFKVKRLSISSKTLARQERTRLPAVETKAVLVFVEDPARVADAGAVEHARIVSRSSRQLLRAPKPEDVRTRRSKLGSLPASSISTGSEADQGRRKSLNVRFDGGSQVVEITPKARRSRSRSQLVFNVTDSGAVSIQEARLSQAEAVAALKEPIEDVGFEVTVRMAPSNRPVAQCTVSVKDLGMTCGSCVSTAGGAFCQDVQVNLLAELVKIDFLEPMDRSTEEADVILQEAIDVVKSLVIVGGQLVEPLQLFEGAPWWPNSGPQW